MNIEEELERHVNRSATNQISQHNVKMPGFLPKKFPGKIGEQQ